MYKMLRFVVAAIGLSVVYGQSSPCPDIFEYVSDQNGMYGLLHVQPPETVKSIAVKINLTVATRIATNYVGSIEPLGAEKQLLDGYNRGSSISYRVNFPVTNPLPKLTSLTVNDRVLCYGPGDVPGTNHYVTTITLEHLLYYRGGSGPSAFTQNAPRPQPATTQPTFILEGFPDDQEINIIIASPTTTTKRPPPPNWENASRPYWERPPPDRWGPPPHRPGRPPPTEDRPPPPPPEWDQPPPDWDSPPPPRWDDPPREKPARRPPSRKPTPKEPEPTEEYEVERPRPTSSSLADRNVASGDTCGVNGLDSVPLVYRGTSYERGKWPWLVAIFKRKYTGLSYICAGTLISDRHVATAAHCMQRKNSYTASKDIVVRLGVYNLDDWADESVVIRNLENAAIHEAYNSTTLANDILVLTLDRPVEFSLYIKAACLWSGITDLNAIVESSGVVAGWGASEAGPAGRGEPRMVRMPIVSTTTCRASKLEFHKLTSSKTLCAGDRNGAGPCLGDSGGGLYILDSNTGRWRLRGIVSISLWSQSGEDTCNLNDYIVFTDTAQYLPWIKAAMSTTLYHNGLDSPPPPRWDDPPREKPARRPPSRKPTPKEPEPTEEYEVERPRPTSSSLADRNVASGDTCGVNGLDSVPLVYRGTSYERGKWPWLVAIFKRKYTGLGYICAGTLISDRHVATAAHCMQRKNSYTASKDIVVRLGVYNLDDWADESVVIRNLENAAIHEAYNSTTLANDILVLTLDRPVEFSLYIKAACLWSGITDLNAIVESSGVVAGWGASEAGPAGRGEPRMVRMPIVSTTTCRASKLEFHKLTSSKTLCAGDRNGAGPCLGDSGGGLYILDSNTGRWRLRGIVSISLWSQSGEDTCNLNNYIVFTDTAQYLPWIKAAMST